MAGQEMVEVGDLGVDSDALREVLRYCEMHGYVPPPALPRSSPSSLNAIVSDPRDLSFLQSLDSDRLLKVLSAAHALDIRSLKELICAYIALSIGSNDLVTMETELEMSVRVGEKEEDWLRGKYLGKK